MRERAAVEARRRLAGSQRALEEAVAEAARRREAVAREGAGSRRPLEGGRAGALIAGARRERQRLEREAELRAAAGEAEAGARAAEGAVVQALGAAAEAEVALRAVAGHRRAWEVALRAAREQAADLEAEEVARGRRIAEREG